jgi:hypothetical protein
MQDEDFVNKFGYRDYLARQGVYSTIGLILWYNWGSEGFQS